jgi:hypothetical protein
MLFLPQRIQYLVHWRGKNRLKCPRMWLRVEMLLHEINYIEMKSHLRCESIEMCRLNIGTRIIWMDRNWCSRKCACHIVMPPTLIFGPRDQICLSVHMIYLWNLLQELRLNLVFVCLFVCLCTKPCCANSIEPNLARYANAFHNLSIPQNGFHYVKLVYYIM